MTQSGPLFTLFEVPFNALTAGQYDASTVFDANMPASHVAYSLQTIGLYHAPGQTVRPDLLAWGDVKTAGVREKPLGKCGTFEIDCHLTKFFGGDLFKDYMKRTGLVLLAVILIVVAIVSFR